MSRLYAVPYAPYAMLLTALVAEAVFAYLGVILFSFRAWERCTRAERLQLSCAYRHIHMKKDSRKSVPYVETPIRIRQDAIYDGRKNDLKYENLTCHIEMIILNRMNLCL